MNSAKDADFIEKAKDGAEKGFVLKGDWTVENAAVISRALAKAGIALPEIQTAKISKMDTAGASLIRTYFGARYKPDQFTDRQKSLLDFIPTPEEKKTPAKRMPWDIKQYFIRIGKAGYAVWNFLYEIFAFIGLCASRFFENFTRPQHFRLPAIVRHIQETGIEALPIIGLLAFGISMVISYQGAIQLRKFGADIYTIDLTVISLLREMGVLATAIMVIGRSGSAFAAEIGVMKLRGEIDAMQTMGLDPVETLVLPRLLALLLTLPLLTFFADMVGLAGGGLMALTQLDISPVQYIHRVNEVTTPTMFYVGMIKAPVFAFLIAIICTWQGMNVSGSAEDVGKRTTLAVVQSIFVIVMVDALFSIIFSELEI